MAIEGFELTCRPDLELRIDIRYAGYERRINRKFFIKRAKEKASKIITEEKVEEKYQENYNAMLNYINDRPYFSERTKKIKRQSLKSKETVKKMKLMARNRLIAIKQKELGEKEFEIYFNTVIKALNKFAEEVK